MEDRWPTIHYFWVSYFLKKTIFGVGCPNRIQVDMKFDGNKNLVSKHIENGEFIDDEP